MNLSLWLSAPKLRDYLCLTMLLQSLATAPPDYDTRFFEQTVDHFGFIVTGLTLQQRYLISEQHWQRPSGEHGPGPILFYTGNEGDIIEFANATGFMWELAPKLGALVVFAEARY